ncbi:WAT1-related protein [Camellia lanceoleosa]|uniref:WAT1-related protein n=1 Tax=Camellia lanceoleosa TaxID=1840588 RepID=A0ACC0FXU5_9ERIC|nr:WAT1-related protein [Camellia lanceoleosa]
MGGLELGDYKPIMGVLAMQLTYAGVAISTRAALLQGMSPTVFVRDRACLGLRSFGLIFLASLVGVTINQNIYFEGIYLASSSMVSAMFNLVPAITFIVASIIGMRSVAKIIRTVFCVVGAISMALLRGPKLLNSEFLLPAKSLFSSGGENWLLGSLLLFGSSCCWSFWIIFQVPVSSSHPDHLSLSAWMCFMASLQSATIALFFAQDLKAWTLHSYLELACCFYAGIIGSAINFFVQAWCISRRGPLFCAMFSPLATVIVTIFASIFLHEEIYTSSLIGAVCAIVGLYVVLWGKAKDLEEPPKPQNDQATNVQILVEDESSKKMTYNNDLEEPFLS